MPNAIKSFDGPTVKQTRILLEKKLKELADELGVNISVGNASFARTGENVTYKIEMALLAANGEPINQESVEFAKYAILLGLKPTDLNRKFIYLGEEYTVIGLRPRATKNNISVRRTKGMKMFVVPAGIVKKALENEDAKSL